MRAGSTSTEVHDLYVHAWSPTRARTPCYADVHTPHTRRQHRRVTRRQQLALGLPFSLSARFEHAYRKRRGLPYLPGVCQTTNLIVSCDSSCSCQSTLNGTTHSYTEGRRHRQRDRRHAARTTA
eukprot:6160510-Pleurochrysis_carterae.AAC.1